MAKYIWILYVSSLNRDRNDNAMHDALWHIIGTAEQALHSTDGKSGQGGPS